MALFVGLMAPDSGLSAKAGEAMIWYGASFQSDVLVGVILEEVNFVYLRGCFYVQVLPLSNVQLTTVPQSVNCLRI